MANIYIFLPFVRNWMTLTIPRHVSQLRKRVTGSTVGWKSGTSAWWPRNLACYLDASYRLGVWRVARKWRD